jgi:hypothetical protein
VAALAEVLTCDQLLMCSEYLIEGLADQFQRGEVRDPAVGEYRDLKLDRKEVPW